MIIVPPVFTADVVIYNETHGEEWSIASIENKWFINSLNKALSSINERSGLLSTAKQIRSGMRPLDFDFDPIQPTDSSFFNAEAKDQWLNQYSVAEQTLIQMELSSRRAPLAINETVLVRSADERLDGNDWINNYELARVDDIKDGDKYVLKSFLYELLNGKKRIPNDQQTVERGFIRKFSSNENKQFSVGDWVFTYERDTTTGEEIKTSYLSGLIAGISAETGLLSIRLHNTNLFLEDHEGVHPENVLMVAENPEFLENIAPISFSNVEKTFKSVISGKVGGVADGNGGEDSLSFETFHFGNGKGKEGTVITALWSGGNAALKFDGLYRVEVNIFSYVDGTELATYFQTKFLSKFENMKIVARDVFPRGYGKVVNFKDGMKDFPHWMNNDMTEKDGESEWDFEEEEEDEDELGYDDDHGDEFGYDDDDDELEDEDDEWDDDDRYGDEI